MPTPFPDLTEPELLDVDPIKYPIPGVESAQILRERWRINADAYDPVDPGTAHPDDTNYPGFYLGTEKPYRRTEYHVYFERAYATIPSGVPDDPLDYTASFPGYYNLPDTIQRQPVTIGVAARVVREFFLHLKPALARIGTAASTAATDVIAFAGHPYEDGDQVRFIEGDLDADLTAGDTYYARDVVAGVSFKIAATAGGAAIDLSVDSTNNVFERGIPRVPRQRWLIDFGGGNLSDVDNLNASGAGFTYDTTPSLQDYKQMVTDQVEIVPEESTLVQHFGPIWERRTIKVIVQ